MEEKVRSSSCISSVGAFDAATCSEPAANAVDISDREPLRNSPRESRAHSIGRDEPPARLPYRHIEQLNLREIVAIDSMCVNSHQGVGSAPNPARQRSGTRGRPRRTPSASAGWCSSSSVRPGPRVRCEPRAPQDQPAPLRTHISAPEAPAPPPQSHLQTPPTNPNVVNFRITLLTQTLRYCSLSRPYPRARPPISGFICWTQSRISPPP